MQLLSQLLFNEAQAFDAEVSKALASAKALVLQLQPGPSDPKRTTIQIRVTSGKTIDLSVELSDTIRTIKEMVQGKEGIPSEEQQLVFAGKEMNNNRSVADYNLQSLSRPLYLVRNQGLVPREGTIEQI
mmetsp:Transcript_30103/g.86204  ORF Transcript_30103/g.86204 Transcript_30103/m.86204 type:complete len:129 (-) Transcript_30103:307-693(-)